MSSVLLGSSSKIKKTAITSAFGSRLAKIECFPSNSGVPDQPIGQEQTRQGAFNRAIDARNNCGNDFDFVIGIENGIWETPENLVDGACICILPRAWEGDLSDALASLNESDNGSENLNRPHFLWSDTIIVPPVHERPFEEGPNGEWADVKDPHAVLTNGKRPRAEFLRSALVPFVEKLQRTSL